MNKLKRFAMDGDSLFKLMNDEDAYQAHIEEKINFLKENYASLDYFEKEKLIDNIIHDFSMFGSSFDLTKLPVFAFLDTYEKDFKSYFKDKVSILFEINNYQLAEEYILKNYEELKNEFHKKYIVFFHFNSLDDFGFDEFEYKMNALMLYGEDAWESRDLFIVPGSYKANPLTYLLFKYFKDDITFLYPKGEEGCLKGFYFDLNWQYFKKMLVDLERQGDYTNLENIINEIIYHQKVFTYPEGTEDFFKDFTWIEKIAKSLHRSYRNESSLLSSRQSTIYDTFKIDEKYMLDNNPSSKVLASKVFSKEFFANLNYLKTLSKADWPSDEVYLNGIKIFYDFLLEYNPKFTKLTMPMARRILNRVILGTSLFDVLKINNDLSLIHYYRTDEIDFFDYSMVNLESIEKSNPKEFIQLKKIYKDSLYHFETEDPNNIDNVRSFIHSRDKETVISSSVYNLLDFFGFNRAKKILLSKISIELINQLIKLKFADEIIKEKFLSILFSDLPLLKRILKNSKDIINLQIVFESLYNNDFKPLTLPQIAKRVENYECYLTPNTQKIIDNLLLLNQVSKGEPLANKVSAIKLYDEYRLREYSSIPDISGKYQNLEYSLVDMHAPEIISNGIGKYMYPNNSLASSCLTPAGKAASCMEHGAINPHGRFFKITLNGKIIAYSWVWRAGHVLCFDNIEITSEVTSIPNYESLILDIYRLASKEIMSISASNEEKPIKASIIGANPIDVLFPELKKLTPVKSFVKEHFKPNNSDKLYLTDSKEYQYLLEGKIDESINTEDAAPIYKYQRPKIREFSSVPYKELKRELNSIYFDYCIYVNRAYQPIKDIYESGYLGEDWFIGYKANGEYDLYYANPKEDTLKEISQFVDLNNVIVKPMIYIAKDYSVLDHYLDSNNYDIKKDDLKEYLRSLKEIFAGYSPNGYFHSPGGKMKALGQILLDGAITSSSFGNHQGGNGSNGSHFICVAEIGTKLYHNYSTSEGFIINPNICAFKTAVIPYHKVADNLTNSRSVIRISGGEGECQVLDYISLSSVDCMTINPFYLENIAKILYLQEFTKQDIPLVLRESFKTVDKEELKRLIKLK